MRKRMFLGQCLKLGWHSIHKGRQGAPPKAGTVQRARVAFPPGHLLQPIPPGPGPGMAGVKLPRAPWHTELPRMSGSPPPQLFFLFAFFLLN